MHRVSWVVMVLALLGGGCTGALVQALEDRQVASCVWFSTPLGHGVSATGGLAIERCLADPCRGR